MNNKNALLVIDLQNDVLASPGTWDAEGVAGEDSLLSWRKKCGAPVIWCRTARKCLLDLMSGRLRRVSIPSRANPVSTRYLVIRLRKQSWPRFSKLTVSSVSWCVAHSRMRVRASVHGALVRGYDVTLVSDAHTTGEYPAEFSGGEVISARTKINFTNMYVQWGSEYPGRAWAQVATAAEVNLR